jgi:hypothetical protein
LLASFLPSFLFEVQLPWNLVKLKGKDHVFMQYILGSLSNNCNKQQKIILKNTTLVIHAKYQHFGLCIIEEITHFSEYCNSQYIEACLRWA